MEIKIKDPMDMNTLNLEDKFSEIQAKLKKENHQEGAKAPFLFCLKINQLTLYNYCVFVYPMVI